MRVSAILIVLCSLIISCENGGKDMKMASKPLTIDRIKNSQSDKELEELLFNELDRQMGYSKPENLESFVAKLKSLPVGLRAMAATHQLDVSMALDDLGWHFMNWHHKDYAQETLAGLRELGAKQEAKIFEKAYTIALCDWDFFAAKDFIDAYSNSGIEKKFDPLNDQLWRMLGYRGKTGISLFTRWTVYARKYPEKVCGNEE